MGLLVKSEVKKVAAIRVSGDLIPALEKKVTAMLKDAVSRAKANGRQTLRPADL